MAFCFPIVKTQHTGSRMLATQAFSPLITSATALCPLTHILAALQKKQIFVLYKEKEFCLLLRATYVEEEI